MKTFNISRLVEASPFVDKLSDVAVDALCDFIDECGYTLDNINVDDMIINGIRCITEDEYLEYEDSYSLLVQDDKDYYVFN